MELLGSLLLSSVSVPGNANSLPSRWLYVLPIGSTSQLLLVGLFSLERFFTFSP